jgi:uncharacterized coiled-coil protein SlyX
MQMLRRLRRRRLALKRSHEVRLATLERRVAGLEELIEALQDAVHRESVRRDQEAAEVKRQIAAPELARSLSEDARKRGLE